MPRISQERLTEIRQRVNDQQDLLEHIESLERELEDWKKRFFSALESVDEVFQYSYTNPKPLLPHFLRAGEDKFKGVIKLAKEYVRLTKDR